MAMYGNQQTVSGEMDGMHNDIGQESLNDSKYSDDIQPEDVAESSTVGAIKPNETQAMDNSRSPNMLKAVPMAFKKDPEFIDDSDDTQ